MRNDLIWGSKRDINLYYEGNSIWDAITNIKGLPVKHMKIIEKGPKLQFFICNKSDHWNMTWTLYQNSFTERRCFLTYVQGLL